MRERARKCFPTTDNSRASASVRGDDEHNHRHGDAKNRKVSVDAAMEGNSVEIGFGRHGI